MNRTMRYVLTAASQRAVAAACHCPSADARTPGPGLLLGLLAESECRAAAMLARHGITAEAVRQRWPAAEPSADSPARDNSGLGNSGRANPGQNCAELLAAVAERLPDDWRRSPVATEHLLLGLLVAGDQTSYWLAEQGLSAAEVEDEIRRIYQYSAQDAAPLDFPTDEEPILPMPARQLPPESPLQLPSPVAASGSVLLRILDAAANRAREGLRVIEDFARFGLGDAPLTAELKTLRHDLTAALGLLPTNAMLASRDTPGDVGTAISTPAEAFRAGIDAVLAANLKRLQESLRSLEEYGKLVSPEVGRTMEQLRYRSYTIEQRMQLHAGPRQLLAGAQLYVLVDGRSTLEEFEDLFKTIVDSGADVVQLRDKSLADAALVERGLLARELTRASRTLFIVNDRPDMALACDADGVHVGQDELPVGQARRILGSSGLVGLSTHSVEQAMAAVGQGPDYIGLGPVFPSSTKGFSRFPGLELLREVSGRIALPAFAIGGIDLGNIGRVLETGIRRIAVSGAVCQASDPAAVIAALRAQLNAAG